MKKKILLATLAVLGICGGITANQGDIQILAAECECCENAQNTKCYVTYGYEVIFCGTGQNICDLTPPED